MGDTGQWQAEVPIASGCIRPTTTPCRPPRRAPQPALCARLNTAVSLRAITGEAASYRQAPDAEALAEDYAERAGAGWGPKRD
jgi:hypothetical protein